MQQHVVVALVGVGCCKYNNHHKSILYRVQQIFCFYYWASSSSSSSFVAKGKTTTTRAAFGGLTTPTTTTTSSSLVLRSMTSKNNNNKMVLLSSSTTTAADTNDNNINNNNNDDVQLYHEMVASTVDLSNAHVTDDGILTVTRTVRDLDNNKKRRFLYTMFLPSSSAILVADKSSTNVVADCHISMPSPHHQQQQQPPTEYQDSIKLRLPSPSGNKLAIFRQEQDTTTHSSRTNEIVEIWHGSSLQQRIILSSDRQMGGGGSLRRHGKVIYDPSGFGQPTWSANEDVILYLAERNPPKLQSFFSSSTTTWNKNEKNNNNKGDHVTHDEQQQPQQHDDTTTSPTIDSSRPFAIGSAFTRGIGKLETWGEKYGKQSPLLDMYLVHSSTGRVGRIENVPRTNEHDNTGKHTNNGGGGGTDWLDDGITLGQAVLSPTLSHVVYTAWHVDTTGSLTTSTPTTDSRTTKTVEKDDDKEPHHYDTSAIRMARRFGLIYCQQRPCQLYASPIQQLVRELSDTSSSGSPNDATPSIKDGNFIPLTPHHRIAFSPRFGPRTTKTTTTTTNTATLYHPMVFLSSIHGFDTHSGCLALSVLEWDVVDENGIINTTTTPNLNSLRIVVDQVQHPNKDSATANQQQQQQQVVNMSFPGLFLQKLPDACFVAVQHEQQQQQLQSLFVITDTQWGSVQRIVRIALDSGKVELLPFQLVQNSSDDKSKTNDDDGSELASSIALTNSQTLLAITQAGGAIVAESSPNQPTSMAYLTPSQVGRFCSEHGQSFGGGSSSRCHAISFSPILASTICSSTLSPRHRGPWGIQYQVINLVPPPMIDGMDHDPSLYPLQCILIRPPLASSDDDNDKAIKKVPLIVIVHGGPHSCFPTSFNPAMAFLCASGYALLMVNYRGSTGFGQAGINILPGRIGSLDVQDVVFATNTILQSSASSSWIDKDRLGIIGGSHGGFLTAHLTGQYPGMFRAAAMRNPVTNIATMVSATDIPDWCHVEAGLGNSRPFTDTNRNQQHQHFGSYDWTKFSSPTQDDLVAMFAKSPAAHVHDVITPTLVALGLSDQRVPPSQGLEWYYTLRSKRVPTKLLVYEDNDHGIDGVESEADHWINIKRWMDKYLLD